MRRLFNMKKLNFLSLIIILFAFFAASNTMMANYKGDEKDKGKKPALQKTTLDPRQSLMNINNVTMWVTEEGFHDWVVASSWNGAFPNGSSIGAIFAEGVVWGGQVNDGRSPVVRVNGNTYGTGCAPITRLFRVRPDYLTGDLSSDAATFNGIPVGQVTEADIQALRDQYAKDWNEWPAKGNPNSQYGDQGAPFEDVDDDGLYDPTVDIPGIPGASQCIFIKYNDDLSESNYGSPPIGLEVSEVYWAYAYSGALGNVIYKQMTMVYTGTPQSSATATIDSMFIVQWADPDVGTSSDDFAGCDTTLNLGYAFTSGTGDATYAGLGLPSPAVGYDFFSGASSFTGNLNDSAVVDLQWKKGYKYINQKPMSSFIYFAAGGNWSDPGFNYNGTLEFYNLMRGKLPIPRYPSGSPFPVEVADVTPYGTYLLAGDPSLPASPTNKIDGVSEGPGDRRTMCVNGPITMSLGDTAQIVLGIVYGLGQDNLGSVTALKQNDNTAQIVFDQLFQLPSIKPPKVKVAALSNEVVLNWGFDEASISEIENFNSQSYTFQGYEVYQVPSSSSSLADGILLGTWDIADGVTAIYDDVPDANGTLIPTLVANGTDKGLTKYLTIKQDQIRKAELKNGQEYYFAVVAYAYNPTPLLPFHVIRSPFVIQRVTPQTTKPGDRLYANVGDSIQVSHSQGHSDGNVVVLVVDPTITTGHQYRVDFATDGTWSITDVTTGTVKLSGQTNQVGDNDYAIVDGLLVKVIGPPVAINTWSFTPSAARWFTGYSGLGGDQFFGGLVLGSDFFGSNITSDQYVTVELRFVTDRNNGQRAYRYLRGGTPNYGYVDYEKQYFTLWDVDANPPQQLSVAYVEQAGNPSADATWMPTANSADREYLFFLKTPYSDTPDPALTSLNLYGDADQFATLYGLWPLQRGSMPFNPQDGQVFTIIPNYANTAADQFTFTAPAPKTSSMDLAKKDVEKINVFPNPYYGYQYRELAPNNKYVTFSHLPDNAIIRIFDLSGVLVKTITHIPNQGQFETWNLANDSNYPVASGIYIVYIDMPDLGTTKVLKLAIIQEQQMLKTY